LIDLILQIGRESEFSEEWCVVKDLVKGGFVVRPLLTWMCESELREIKSSDMFAQFWVDDDLPGKLVE
jgi:hypothetical protein